MRIRTILCDNCGKTICDGDVNIISYLHGSTANLSIDLCGKCRKRLLPRNFTHAQVVSVVAKFQ